MHFFDKLYVIIKRDDMTPHLYLNVPSGNGQLLLMIMRQITTKTCNVLFVRAYYRFKMVVLFRNKIECRSVVNVMSKENLVLQGSFLTVMNPVQKA